MLCPRTQRISDISGTRPMDHESCSLYPLSYTRPQFRLQSYEYLCWLSIFVFYSICLPVSVSYILRAFVPEQKHLNGHHLGYVRITIRVTVICICICTYLYLLYVTALWLGMVEVTLIVFRSYVIMI